MEFSEFKSLEILSSDTTRDMFWLLGQYAIIKTSPNVT